MRKCPYCGEPLESGVNTCPACGGLMKIENAVDEVNTFIDELSELEIIAKSKKSELNAQTSRELLFDFSKDNIIAIAIFILCTAGLALIVLIPFMVFKYLKRKLSIQQQFINSTEFIEYETKIKNYNCPNDKDAYLELLSFIKGKITSLNKSHDLPSIHIKRVWAAKGEDVYKKAINFSNEDDDSAAIVLYEDIKTNNITRLKNTIQNMDNSRYLDVITTTYNDFKNLEGYILKKERQEKLLKTCLALLLIVALLFGCAFSIRKTVDYFSSRSSGNKYSSLEDDLGNEEERELIDCLIPEIASVEFSAVEWPQTELTGKFPTPPSTWGKIISSNESYVIAVLWGFDRETYNTYVDQLISYNYTSWATRTKDSYEAKKRTDGEVDDNSRITIKWIDPDIAIMVMSNDWHSENQAQEFLEMEYFS